MGPLLDGKPRLYLRECLSARSSWASLPESVSSRLMERNFFKGILREDNQDEKLDMWIVELPGMETQKPSNAFEAS